MIRRDFFKDLLGGAVVSAVAVAAPHLGVEEAPPPPKPKPPPPKPEPVQDSMQVEVVARGQELPAAINRYPGPWGSSPFYFELDLPGYEKRATFQLIRVEVEQQSIDRYAISVGRHKRLKPAIIERSYTLTGRMVQGKRGVLLKDAVVESVTAWTA
jgi:hypothetical protein